MPLHIALVLSLAFHLALYTLADWSGLRAPPPPAPRPLIEAMLILPEIEVPPPAEPQAEPDVPPAVAVPAVAPPASATPVAPPAPTARAARTDLKPPAARPPPRLFYPREAVLRGLEGEALVNVTLDASGRVLEARIERSSGHAILDEAALSAALALPSVPGGGREAILPVRFKLN